MIYRLAIAALSLAACTDGTNPLSMTLASASDTAAYTERRAAVELYVKSNFNAVISDISTGSGPSLDRAMDIAGIPVSDRPARAIQLRSDLGLYRNAPGPLVQTLMLYAG